MSKTELFIQKARLAHDDHYDYSKSVYVGYYSKVEIVCPVHGSFWQRPGAHLNGHGCAKCRNEQIGNSKRISQVDIIDQFREVHGDKYDYSKVEYVSAHVKVTITCPEHGDFEQKPNSHKNGRGCMECARKSRGLRRRNTTESMIEQFRATHGDRYDYSLVEYDGSKNKVTIICPDHREFRQSPSNHGRGHHCPGCAKLGSHRVSKTSTDWLDSLNLPHLERECKLPESKYRMVDGYDPLTKTVYQFHGDYWHGNPMKYASHVLNQRANKTMGELYEYTVRMDQQIRDWGYNLVTMWEYDWMNKGT